MPSLADAGASTKALSPDLAQFLKDVLGGPPSDAVVQALQAHEVRDKDTLFDCWEEVAPAVPGAARKKIGDRVGSKGYQQPAAKGHAHGNHALTTSTLCPLGARCAGSHNRYYRKDGVLKVYPYVKIFNIRDIKLVEQTFEMDLQCIA